MCAATWWPCAGPKTRVRRTSMSRVPCSSSTRSGEEEEGAGGLAMMVDSLPPIQELRVDRLPFGSRPLTAAAARSTRRTPPASPVATPSAPGRAFPGGLLRPDQDLGVGHEDLGVPLSGALDGVAGAPRAVAWLAGPERDRG